jgi:hypothetical protein
VEDAKCVHHGGGVYGLEMASAKSHEKPEESEYVKPLLEGFGEHGWTENEPYEPLRVACEDPTLPLIVGRESIPFSKILLPLSRGLQS